MTKSKIFFGSALALMLTLCSSPRQGFAKPPPPASDELQALKKEIEGLKVDQAEIQKQIQEIKKLAQSSPAKPRPSAVDKVFSVKGAPFKGDEKAKVTILEFSEYQCPFCASHAKKTMPEIEKQYIATGKVKYVFRDFPLLKRHPYAQKAAEATRCAAEQGKYWEMHTQLFMNSTALKPEDLTRHAAAIGLDMPAFQQCLNSGKHARGINLDMDEGEKAGLTATPFFLIGRTLPDGSGLKVTTAFGGSKSFEAFKAAIDELLAPEPPGQ